MSVSFRKARPNRPNRHRNNMANRPQPTVAIAMSSIAPLAPLSPTLVIVFDQAVILKGTPQYTTDVPTATPVSAVLSSPDTLELTFSEDVSAATSVNVPHEEPSVRNASGGFVTPTAVTV